MATYRANKPIIQATFWLAAVAVGVIGVLFEKLVQWVQLLQTGWMKDHPYITLFSTPVMFLAAAALVVKVAPHAQGSGIPQALKAMMMSLGSHTTAMKTGLISIKTAFIKVVSACIGLLAGASIGREGPTVQISASIFALVGSKTKKTFPAADFHSYLVAGSAAGVAAAFNTPLAGISFALEEMAEGSFAQIKQTVMVSVIIAGIASQTIVGNYVYFGSPTIPQPDFGIAIPAIVIGLVGGIMGGLFARSLAYPITEKFKLVWWHKALVCGIIVGVINFISNGESAGTGYAITRDFMNSDAGELGLLFPIGKLLTTVFSFLSGIAGGIFSPSLAIGAGFGVTTAKIIGFAASLKTCALLGMVAFFTGTVQAPLTAVIIVMEMTDLHEMILPLMTSAFIAQGVSKLIMPKSLYHYLAHHRFNK